MLHNEFFQKLKQEDIANAYLFCGTEEYVLTSALKQLEETVVGGALKDANLVVLPSASDGFAITEACKTIPFMAQKRMIIIYDSIFLAKKRGSQDDNQEENDGASAAKGEDALPLSNNGEDASEKKTSKKEKTDALGESALLEYLSSPCEFSVVVFVTQSPEKRGKVYKAFGENRVVEFNELSTLDTQKWTQKYLRAGGISIDPVALSFLMEYADARPEALACELDKLISYKKEGTVNKDDILAIITPNNEYKIFKMTDALGNKDIKTSLSILSGLLENREEPVLILSTVSKHYRQLLRIKLMQKNKSTRQEIIAATGIKHDFIFNKMDALSKKLTEDALQKAVIMCYEVDKCIKSGATFEETLLHSLFVSLCKL